MIVKSIENIPSNSATDAQWIAWYEVLQPEVGRKEANILFLKAWNQRKNAGILGASSNTSALRDFLKTKGVDVRPDGLLAYPISAYEAVAGGIETFFGISKWTFIIMATIVIIPVAILLFNIAKNPRLLIDGTKAFTGKG
jgi:hypothetical protein